VGIPLVYRVSNLRVGDAVYDVNFRNNFPSVVFGGETDFDAGGAVVAADALNGALNAASPVPKQVQSIVDGETFATGDAYSIPFARVSGDTISVESSGPFLSDIPPISSTWRITSNAADTTSKLSLADFSLLDGQVEPFELASADLIAGGGNARSAVTVGRVRVITADGHSFSLIYEITEPGWCLSEAHAHVAASLDQIPQTKTGNPKVGLFDYSQEGTGCQKSATFGPIAFGGVGGPFVVAAHAVVQTDGAERSETAWGAGVPFPGANWAMAIQIPGRD
jgi:hypothetical protein